MAEKYDEDVKLLEELEGKEGEAESSKVDISPLFAPARRPTSMGYGAAVGLIGALSSGRPMSKQETQPRAASSTLLHVGLEKSAGYETEFMKQAREVKNELQETMRKMGIAAEEKPTEIASAQRQPARLGSVEYALRKLEVMGAKAVAVRRVRDEDLVLPRLSVTDQIGELEKIITGLKEGAFGSDQLEVVGDELYGLSKAVKKRGAQPVVAESNLISLRNERLREATKELEEYLIRSGK